MMYEDIHATYTFNTEATDEFLCKTYAEGLLWLKI